MLKIYLAQLKQGQFEASVPWVPELAEPLRGPSPTQLKEELMFKALELVHGGARPHMLDKLIPPSELQVISVYVDIERKIEPSKPPVPISTVTHVIVGRWDGDPILRMWLPKAPGVCLALRTADEVYAATASWAKRWADQALAEDLTAIECPYWGKIDELEVDLGFPDAVHSESSGFLGKGRMRRPVVLTQIATNLTHRAADEALQPAFGRERLVEQLIEVLTSPRPVNICLVGPSGVGKSSVIHEAVRRVHKLQKLYQARRDFWETSGDRIIAGMSVIGQWEQRVASMIDELSERQDILVSQDLLGLVRAGRTYQGDSNVARFIEPALEQDRFSVITEATEESFVMARSMAPGFVDKFRRLNVPELGWKDTLSVLSELVRGIEGEHDVIRFAPDGVETILGLTRRFFRQQAFPGKAVRLTRQCEMAALRAFHEAPSAAEQIVIDTAKVATVMHAQTGLPRAILEPGTGREPAHIREALEARIFAQPDAIEAITKLIVSIEQGLADPNKPLGTLLLVGPSGVGKTETAKALAEQLFGDEDRMLRFDMSEFSNPMAVSRLIGTTRQPDGELTGKVRLQPFCVVLLDEIEKAHQDVHDLLLQVLGDGRLTDAAGRTVDFRNAVLIMTSNLGAGSEDHWMGFHDRGRRDRHLHYKRAVEGFFRPEFFNRIDHIVAYNPLGARALRRIAGRTLRALLERRGLRQAQVMVDVDEALIEHLIEGAVDPRYGARTLARRIERSLISPLARRLTQHDVTDGLTRVRVRAAEEPGAALSLDLQVIARAPVLAPPTQVDVSASVGDEATTSHAQWVRGDGRAALDAEQLVEELGALIVRLDEIEQRAEVKALQSEYDALLAKFNDSEDQVEFARSELAEHLRQREIVLRRASSARAKLDGLLDPRGEGEYVIPLAQEIDMTKRRIWSPVVVDLHHEVSWLDVQIRSLMTQEADSATLVVTGLSGPSSGLLDLWLRVIRALDELFELELTYCHKIDGTWRPLKNGARRGQAFAVSTEAPGLFALFDTLGGYAWSPRQPSHGQHALVLLSNYNKGFVGEQALAEALSSGEFDGDDDAGGEFVEFIERRGQLHDLRNDRSLPLSGERASNIERFALRLVMERIGLRGEVYGERMRSGMWRALTPAQVAAHSVEEIGEQE